MNPCIAASTSTPGRGLRLAVALTSIVLAASACAGHGGTTRADTPATFVLVRHAEKATSAADPRDPPLSAAGELRAHALALAMADAPLVAVYATPWRRTQATAGPTAAAHDIVVTVEDPAGKPAGIAAALRARHRTGTVLVVGHSNTVPPLVAALCGCPAPAIADDAFGDRFTVDTGDDGRPRLRHDRFGP